MAQPNWAEAHAVLAPRVVVQTIGGEALLLNLNDEAVFSLNESGARIAEQLALGRPVRAIVKTLAEVYGVSPERIEPEVVTLLDRLLARSLIIVTQTAPGR